MKDLVNLQVSNYVQYIQVNCVQIKLLKWKPTMSHRLAGLADILPDQYYRYNVVFCYLLQLFVRFPLCKYLSKFAITN